STSNTISARGLSFCSITFSMICMIAVLARTVIVLLVLLIAIIGWMLICGKRTIALKVWPRSVTSTCCSEHVLESDVGERQVQPIDRGVQERLGRRCPGAIAQLLAGRLGTRSFDAVAD